MMARRTRLTGSIPAGVDAFLVTKIVNVRYLSGFTGSNAALLVPADGPAILATDGRYATQAAQESPDLEILVARRLGAELVDRARRSGVHRLAIERHHVTLTANDALQEAAGDELEFVDGGQAVEELRAVKDEAEIVALREACRVTDEAFAAVIADLRPGVTELEVAWRLRAEMHARGAEQSFDSIVAFGPNSARPHHSPTDRALAKGDFVKLDFGHASTVTTLT